MRNTDVVEQYLNLEEDTNQISTSEEIESPISLDYAIQSLQDKKSYAPYEEIINIYHETCKELPRVKNLSQRIKQRITEIWKKVGGNMQKIREVFAKICTSDFLSGRIVGKTWRADLAWIMQWDKFEDVLRDKYAKNYSNAGRQGYEKGKSKLQRFGNILSHNWDFARLEELEEQYIEEQAKHYKGLESDLLHKLNEINAESI
ncbi:MAG: hypothetical protein RSD98_10145 [Niameybacter sp.]